MNNYPEWWNQTITIYNKSENSDGSINWIKSHVSGCFWKNDRLKVTLGSTSIDSDSIMCRIPKSDKFVEKHTYDSLSTYNKSSKFTLAPGDIIVLGNVTDSISEYTSGQRSSDLLKKYRKLQGCMQINSVSINTDGGRGNEHYYVRGI